MSRGEQSGHTLCDRVPDFAWPHDLSCPGSIALTLSTPTNNPDSDKLSLGHSMCSLLLRYALSAQFAVEPLMYFDSGL